jgi:hypothetical protein
MPEISFEDIWREHKRFILAVGSGAIVYFSGLSWVWATDATVASYVRQGRQTETEIQSLADQIAGREGFEEGVAIALEKEIAPAARDAVEFRSRPAFALKEGDSPFIVYRQAIEQCEAARTEAKRRNMNVPEEFGVVKDPPEDRVRVHIAGADLLERVLSTRSVETLRGGEPDYSRTVEEPEEKPGAEAPPADAPAAAEPPALRRLPVRVSATGSVDAVELFLSGFQRSGAALEVVSLRIARTSDGLVRLDAEVAALSLVPAAEAKSARPASAGRTGRTPARTGGRIR